MEIRLNNYHARYEDGCVKVSINGSKIVNKSAKLRSRRELMLMAYDEIEKFNRENGLRWGVYFE
jgi:hypothetical protein